MADTNLRISVIQPRMLKLADAAESTGLPQKHFKSVCSVNPIEMRPNMIRYDRLDLDRWIDQQKEGAEATSQADILGKL